MDRQRWTDAELAEFEDPDMWDFDHAEIHPPVPNACAVVSVRFNAREFDLVACAARRAGKSLTTFIRDAALREAALILTSVDTAEGDR